ncbi:CEP20 [Symbiodinium sp. CCMP2592]|nr:CEP20 [Symbiodinium sp. CCMP2592]
MDVLAENQLAKYSPQEMAYWHYGAPGKNNPRNMERQQAELPGYRLLAVEALPKVKAKVRAEIFAALDDEQVQRPQLPRENALINELIKEYFEYNGYYHALSVLLAESGHPEEPQFDRRFLASELRVREDDRSRSHPLIYALVRGACASDVGAPPAAMEERTGAFAMPPGPPGRGSDVSDATPPPPEEEEKPMFIRGASR